MSFFSRIKDWLPKPFKYIQKQLEIQTQWIQFKSNIKPHRYKIYLLLLIATYPLYNPYFKHYIQEVKQRLTIKTHQSLQPDQPAFQIGQNLVKNLIGSLLTDQNIKTQGLNFVQNIINDQKFVGQILELLLTALKNEQFLKTLGDTSKDLILTQMRDPQISGQLATFVQKTVSSQQTRNGFIQLIKEAFSSKQSIQTIVNLLSKGVTSPDVKEALSDTVNFSVKQLLADQETINQLKVFIFFLLRKFENDDQIKGMMDILFAKGLGIVKKNKKHPQLQKILKMGRQRPVDYL